ncbi:phosphopentomutase/phosphoglucosamine mutase [Halorussus salinus]|uniref:phosphopentomutase/phosphoglucosamine mutase n=1 Tax=Halorussus salinus TaxID=1364935 RepID=UPI0010927BF2|nr:phosphopentomutase/phosphoglucosamine mutase [Halorussus salinus]
MTLFGTAGIRGSAVDTVTPELALAVGRAAGRDGEEFVVARDGRETGSALAAAMEAGLESAGADVRRAGQLPTPALAYASRGRRGAMLTASHNPPTDNGIKLFVDGEEYDRDAERTVEERVAADDPSVGWDRWGDSERVSVLDDYRDAVIEYAQQQGAPLDGLRVVVDCGNGMAAVATPQVLRALGAEVVTLNANVDGHFPGRESKPTPETLEDLREFLREDPEADLGIGHDGDADRIVIVDGDGEVVHEDTVVALLAAHYTDGSDAGDPVVVTTPNASGRIDEQVEEAGGRVERVRLGALHEGIAAARDDTEVVFAAEPWKHVHTQFGGWIDGVTSAAVISRLVADADGLAPLREPVTERPYRKVSVSCPDDAKAAVMERLETAIPEAFSDAEVATEYGVRATLPDASWVLVRPSGTEPYVRVYAESDDVDALVATASEAVEEAVEAES